MRRVVLGMTVALLAAAPAQAQMAVFDAAAFTQALQSVITEGQQLATLGQQLDQQVSQYQQTVQNARALANLNSLLQQYQINPAQLSATQLSLLFNDVYGLTASDPNFIQNARNLLGQQYALPMPASAAQSQANALFSASDATTVATDYNRNNRDLGQALQYSDVLTQAIADRQQAETQVQTQVGTVQGLGDNSSGATLHALAVGQLNAQQQNDALLRLQAMQADKQIQDQLRQVERDTAIQQSILDQTQAKVTFRNGAAPSLTASSVSFQ